MDFKNIQTFIKVAELGSFSIAASELGYSQSAVSTQIANLERELGHLLFDRIGHKIMLTAGGIIFFQYAQNMQMLSEELRQQLNGDPNHLSGTIRIAMADSICTATFPRILLDFQNRFHNIKIVIRTGVTSDMFTMLMHNEIDMVCTLDTKIKRPDLIVLKEAPVDVTFYISAKHPLAHKSHIRIQDLQQYPMYLTEENISYRKDLDHILGEQNEYLMPTYEIGNAQVIKELILNSFGIGFIPKFMVEHDLADGTIIPIPYRNFPITVWKQLICHRGKALTPAMQALIDAFTF